MTISPIWLGLFYVCSEIFISTKLRSKSSSGNEADRGSLRLIWIVVNISVTCGVLAYIFLPAAAIGAAVSLYWVGFALFVTGLLFRWYSIYYLGRFFTVNVTVHADHKIIDSGPYRHIRHPSYSGNLLAFLGLALTMANYVTVFFLVVPIAAVFMNRIRIEEAALLAGLGEPYKQYMQRTKRLIPFVY
ncbi:MAG TPA: isoprenylcysteine carboxylmethyltransferase family protein [Steroidobacteraceae bacterium]|nr:isoprenylcysteine carboxylmethyltransferase family protein [Steroidobacteraceae bacterium]